MSSGKTGKNVFVLRLLRDSMVASSAPLINKQDIKHWVSEESKLKYGRKSILRRSKLETMVADFE
jgi:hypothetical protein